MNTILFLLYSLLPGLSKIMGNQLPFILNIPILIALFLTNQKKISWRSIDNYILLFIIYGIFISFISLAFLPSDSVTLFMGIYMYLIPVCGYFFAYLIDFDEMVKTLKVVALAHVFFAILIYPLTPLYPYITGYAQIFRKGVFGERMCSVSGSLGFASLMLICFTTFFFNSKSIKDTIILLLVTVGLIFAQQRGAWLGGITVIFLDFLEKIKTGHLKIKQTTIVRGLVILVLGGILVGAGVFKVESLTERYKNQLGKEAVDERQSQWSAGIENMINFPLGTGVGQVGQVARVGGWSVFKACADGDYPRIFSETGVPGLLFYVFLFVTSGLLFLYSRLDIKAVKTGLFVFIGISMQMIGSNVTEFYFVNFLYWMFVGYMVSDIRTQKSKMIIV
jgi:hypothetical protein